MTFLVSGGLGYGKTSMRVQHAIFTTQVAAHPALRSTLYQINSI